MKMADDCKGANGILAWACGHCNEVHIVLTGEDGEAIAACSLDRTAASAFVRQFNAAQIETACHRIGVAMQAENGNAPSTERKQ